MYATFRHFVGSSLALPGKEETMLRMATFGMLLGMGCSWPLWTNRLAFPMLPLWGEATLQGPVVEENVKALVTVLLLVVFLCFPRKGLLHVLVLVWMTWLVSIDVNRLQPWVWFYGLLWLLVWPPKKAAIGEGRGKDAAPALPLLLLASVYAWGGFYKLTPYFVEGNWPWFCDAFEATKPLGNIQILGYAPGLLELLLGLGLLSHKTRAWAARLLIAFHAVILLFLIKIDWNWVVVPWNIALMGLLWFYLSSGPFTPPLFSKTNRLLALNLLVLLFPALSLLSLLPHNLSWKLYDNTQSEAVFYGENPVFQSEALQNVWKQHSYDAGTRLYLGDWCQSELKVPMYPGKGAFAQTGRYLCGQLTGAKGASGLWVLEVWPWEKGGEREEEWPCE